MTTLFNEQEAVGSPVFDDYNSTAPAAASDVTASAADSTASTRSGYLQYRALYDYEARNEDELSFQVNFDL